MRNPVFLLLLLLPAFSFARQGDTAFYRHQWSVGITNAMSHVFADGPSGPVTQISTYGGEVSSTTTYLPLYTFHLRLGYSLGISRHVRLETGLGYALEGYTVRESASGGYVQNDVRYTGYTFTGQLTVPVYVTFIKRIGAGAFTCMIGPEFTLPVQSLSGMYHYTINGRSMPDHREQMAYSSDRISAQSAMGATLKMGYQKYFPQATMDIGPIIRFSDLVALDKDTRQWYTHSGYRPYHYYIGVDVALYFGIKKQKARGKNNAGNQ